ncbi:MAG: hypothetical protein EPN85_05480 [Bacteroidetes bacterium]|nr:MAG: hypothetical protein EPN85_05480 [Bacteroidota bacterium]
MKNKIHIVFLSVSLTICVNVVFAQRDSVAKAIVLAQDQNIAAEVRVKKALEIIDNSITHAQSVKDPFAWYVRGYIYKEWYKTFEPQNKKSKTRLEAMVFLKKALELDTSHGKSFSVTSNFHYSGQIATVTLDFDPKTIRQILKYLGATFYNDAGSLLDPDNYPAAIENYEKFKECMLIAEPNYNLKAREIEFKNALATVYEKIFRSDIKMQSQFFGMTENLYRQVLALDTNNWGANYNLAMLYYNYGVDLINNMNVTDDIVVVDNITDESTALFKKALPFALKANALKPDRREVLVCLMGIYFSLYEWDKSDEYKAKIALLDKEK